MEKDRLHFFEAQILYLYGRIKTAKIIPSSSFFEIMSNMWGNEFKIIV